MSDDLLKQAFERIAERAGPAEGLAERALNRAARRRRARITAAAAAMAAVVAVPAAVVQLRASEPPASPLGPSGPPANTAAELAVARACLRDGPPAGHMGETRPDLGRPGDFRLLARVRLADRYVATVGDARGFVLCSAMNGRENSDVPTFHPWPPGTGKDLHAFRAPLRVDAIQQVSDPVSTYGLHLVVGGRVKPEVKRVKVVWSDDRAGEAAVERGYFVARIPDRVTNGSGPSVGVVSVTGYGADGRVLHTWRPEGHEGKQFTPMNCTDGVTTPRPALCTP